MRVGQGFDVHKFGPGDKIVIGGVVIPFEKGLIAHSDGDVLLHAICDALLGAAGLGDIGQHFPDTDPQFRDVNSRTLLRLVVAKIRAEGWTPVNCDSTIIAEKPYMARHIPFMRENLAADLNLELNAVNVKATTSEGLGFTGRQEGIAAQASVLLTVLST
ncbi:2-C-methyl-D-erythritol 2,4-cyclodiphosphate synthase [Aurantivibrio infirmus]